MALSPQTQERIFVGALFFLFCVGAGVLYWYEDAKVRDIQRVATINIIAANVDRYFAEHSRYPQKLPDTTVLLTEPGNLTYAPLTAANEPCTATECDTYEVAFNLETNALGILRGPHILTPQGIR